MPGPSLGVKKRGRDHVPFGEWSFRIKKARKDHLKTYNRKWYYLSGRVYFVKRGTDVKGSLVKGIIHWKGEEETRERKGKKEVGVTSEPRYIPCWGGREQRRFCEGESFFVWDEKTRLLLQRKLGEPSQGAR